jgi:chromosome segregation ATPase
MNYLTETQQEQLNELLATRRQLAEEEKNLQERKNAVLREEEILNERRRANEEAIRNLLQPVVPATEYNSWKTWVLPTLDESWDNLPWRWNRIRCYVVNETDLP